MHILIKEAVKIKNIFRQTLINFASTLDQKTSEWNLKGRYSRPRKNITLFITLNVTVTVTMSGERHRDSTFEGTNMSLSP